MKKHNITNEECLQILSEHQEDLFRMALSALTNKDEKIAEEIVQRAYMKLIEYDKLHKCINKDRTLSKSYVFLTVRSVAYDYYILKSREVNNKLIFNNEIEGIQDDGNDVDKNEALGNLVDKMNYYLDTEFSWVDRQIFRLYNDTGLSMQKLSDDSGIAKTSIYLSVKRVKDRLKELLTEDYQDFKNKDYKFIKPIDNE
jgi:RNA polymerase sigma factor (sigma-70 family)